ncbi:unnamed protein product [Brassica oleracea var. botrytis]
MFVLTFHISSIFSSGKVFVQCWFSGYVCPVLDLNVRICPLNEFSSGYSKLLSLKTISIIKPPWISPNLDAPLILGCSSNQSSTITSYTSTIPVALLHLRC